MCWVGRLGMRVVCAQDVREWVGMRHCGRDWTGGREGWLRLKKTDTQSEWRMSTSVDQKGLIL